MVQARKGHGESGSKHYSLGSACVTVDVRETKMIAMYA